ncbi:hypothetical protein CRYUN_Cryun16bG0012400 [Craigia yunnanensis]
MATGKPPWSQQYQEVAALLYVGTTKSHPPIPVHLSTEAKDFLLTCLQKEPDLRPAASELLKENSEIPSSSHATNHECFQVSTCTDSADICNLGSLNCSNAFVEKISESKDLWRMNCSEDDMCQIDKMIIHSDPNCETSHDWKSKFGEDPETVPVGRPTTCGDGGKDFSFTCGPSLSEDDDELTE